MNEKKIKAYVTHESGEKIFFTSDTHFHHENIMRYCNRPFSSIEEHDEALVNNWNSVVPEDGIVYHLGDVGFAPRKYMSDLLDRLNGKKILIIGNHDWRRVVADFQFANKFELMTQQMNLKIENQHIILNHYPMLCYSGTYRKKNEMTWQLFGHVHSGPLSNKGKDDNRLTMLFPAQYDVGVDNNNFKPISFYEVRDIISDRLENMS